MSRNPQRGRTAVLRGIGGEGSRHGDRGVIGDFEARLGVCTRVAGQPVDAGARSAARHVSCPARHAFAVQSKPLSRLQKPHSAGEGRQNALTFSNNPMGELHLPPMRRSSAAQPRAPELRFLTGGLCPAARGRNRGGVSDRDFSSSPPRSSASILLVFVAQRFTPRDGREPSSMRSDR